MDTPLRILEMLDENGLSAPERLKENLSRRTVTEIRSLRESIYECIANSTEAREIQRAPKTIDSANYLAGASLRGDAGCCAPACRVRKVRTLARYGALYCDKVIVPMRLDPDDDSDADDVRDTFCGAALSICELRPLLETGIAVLVPEQLPFCEEHLIQEVPLLPQIEDAAKQFARRIASRLSVRLEFPVGPNDHPAYQVTGPREYIEHGTLNYTLKTVPAWAARMRRRAHAGQKVNLSRAMINRSGVLDSLLAPFIIDASMKEFFAISYNARYVSDLPAQIEFFRALYHDDDLARETSALCAKLTHSIPLLSDIPLKTVLKLRSHEHEAFLNYRATLTKIVKDYLRLGKHVGDAEASEIYSDILKPQLLSLEVQAKNVRRTMLKRAIVKGAASSAVLAIGAFSGILPGQMGDFIKTIGGFSLAKDFLETIGAIEKNPSEIRNHNLYFLLRLKQAAGADIAR